MEKEIKELEEEAVIVDGIEMVSLSVAKRAIQNVYEGRVKDVVEQLNLVLDEYSQVVKDLGKI